MSTTVVCDAATWNWNVNSTPNSQPVDLALHNFRMKRMMISNFTLAKVSEHNSGARYYCNSGENYGNCGLGKRREIERDEMKHKSLFLAMGKKKKWVSEWGNVKVDNRVSHSIRVQLSRRLLDWREIVSDRDKTENWKKKEKIPQIYNPFNISSLCRPSVKSNCDG